MGYMPFLLKEKPWGLKIPGLSGDLCVQGPSCCAPSTGLQDSNLGHQKILGQIPLVWVLSLYYNYAPSVQETEPRASYMLSEKSSHELLSKSKLQNFGVGGYVYVMNACVLVWGPYLCTQMHRPEKYIGCSLALCLLPLRQVSWAQSSPFQLDWPPSSVTGFAYFYLPSSPLQGFSPWFWELELRSSCLHTSAKYTKPVNHTHRAWRSLKYSGPGQVWDSHCLHLVPFPGYSHFNP